MTDPRTVILIRSLVTEFCLVNSLVSYLEFSQDSNIDLKSGYIFRPWDMIKNVISDKPLSSSAVNGHLKGYLQCLRT